MSISIDTIYCLATGKPIGTLNDDEFGLMLDLGLKQDDYERFTLMAMRNSTVWMNLTPERLDHIRETTPRQLLAYLLNRLYAPIESQTRDKVFSLDRKLAAHRERIRIWQEVEYAPIDAEQFETLLFVLLRLDSRFNLTKLVKPTTLATLISDWSKESVDKFIRRLNAWGERLYGDEKEKFRQVKAANEFWHHGNALARKAMIAQFEHAAPVKEIPTAKGVVKKSTGTKVAQETIDFLDQLEAELTRRNTNPTSSGSEAIPATPKPAPKPGVRLTRFGAAKKSEA